MFIRGKTSAIWGVAPPLKYYAMEIGKLIREQHQGGFITFEERYHIARFKKDGSLIEKLEKLAKKKEVYILGDGHDGVWNIARELTCSKHEIVDWYHLMENLHKQNFNEESLNLYKEWLWNGEKEKVISKLKEGNNFRKYLEKHRARLINYNEHHTKELSSIGSGAVESSVKQIKTTTNIAGARWSKNGIRQILSVRTAYLNR